MSNTTLTVHHLGRSQSERIVWLCEELGLDYALVRYERRADNKLAPPAYKALHPLGSAPVITDGPLVLAESAAVVDYVIATYGDGRLAVTRGQPGFADYLYWFHFANGTLQPAVMQVGATQRIDPTRFERVLALVDQRLGESVYLAGPALTAADIMAVFSLTTMRVFKPYDLAPWPNLVAYLQRIGARPAYQRAMQKADPDLTPLLHAAP